MSFGVGPLPFLIIFGVGCILASIYHLIRHLVNKMGSPLFNQIFDCLFMLISGVVFFLISYLTLDGEFRFFMLFGLFLSFATVTLLKRALHKKHTTRKRKSSAKIRNRN